MRYPNMIRNLQQHLIVGIIVLFHTLAPAAGGGQPVDVLRDGVQEGLRILNDPGYRSPARREDQQRQLILVLEQLFDFEEFSRRVLASNWGRFSSSQQETFVRVFKEFLSRYYIGKILDRYKDQSVNYLGQTLQSPNWALVNVEVVWEGQPIPVELPMIKRNGLWKVYEIQVLGISAVSFYRAQFRSLLREESPAQVIDRIRQRIRKIETDS